MNTPRGFDTDHINGNGLDNRKANLRICDHMKNMWNKKKSKDRSSIYKGVVCVKKCKNSWIACITHMKNKMYLGSFKTEIEAAMAYNVAAVKFYGEYARLNIIS